MAKYQLNKQHLKQGLPLIVSQIKVMRIIEPATNIGEFDYQTYYAAKESLKIKYFFCEMKAVKCTGVITGLHKLRFNLQNIFKMPQLLGFLPVNTFR